MRRVLSLLSAAVLMLLAVSCADDAAVMSELDAAESVMEDSPETALALLDTMQRSRLVSRKAAARHALLYSQALINAALSASMLNYNHLADSILSVVRDSLWSVLGPDIQGSYYSVFINNEVTDVCMTVLQRVIATVNSCVCSLY